MSASPDLDPEEERARVRLDRDPGATVNKEPTLPQDRWVKTFLAGTSCREPFQVFLTNEGELVSSTNKSHRDVLEKNEPSMRRKRIDQIICFGHVPRHLQR